MTVLFDESLNDSIQKSEMDIHLRYWREGENRVVVRYWTLMFLGHTRSEDLMAALNDGLKEIQQQKMIQISMDGPNTNLKLLRDVKADREKKQTSFVN